MEIIRDPALMQQRALTWKKAGLSVGFVPTMGYLHEGHLRLVDEARGRCKRTVVSIFVNPMQFGPSEDLDRYPRDEAGDLAKLDQRGVDTVFIPSQDSMYPDGFETVVETLNLPNHLCGLRRKGHFRGVTTVVLKLFLSVTPDVAIFGEKDYQQFLVIRRMAADLNLPIDVVGVPTIRESDGLAMSSRNVFLSPEDRLRSTSIYRALLTAREMVQRGETDAVTVRNEMLRILEAAQGRVDYVAVVHPQSLVELEVIQGQAHAALAVFFGSTRLIDNMRLMG
jgi:pantoate--beta-alanine ligase